MGVVFHGHTHMESCMATTSLFINLCFTTRLSTCAAHGILLYWFLYPGVHIYLESVSPGNVFSMFI